MQWKCNIQRCHTSLAFKEDAVYPPNKHLRHKNLQSFLFLEVPRISNGVWLLLKDCSGSANRMQSVSPAVHLPTSCVSANFYLNSSYLGQRQRFQHLRMASLFLPCILQNSDARSKCTPIIPKNFLERCCSTLTPSVVRKMLLQCSWRY